MPCIARPVPITLYSLLGTPVLAAACTQGTLAVTGLNEAAGEPLVSVSGSVSYRMVDEVE